MMPMESVCGESRSSACAARSAAWPLAVDHHRDIALGGALSDRAHVDVRITQCADAAFTDAPAKAFRQLERSMLEYSDVTVVSAHALEARHRRYARRVVYVPHGVDVEWFQQQTAQQRPLPDLGSITGPIAGFVGRIADWIDLAILSASADALPNWTFVCVGPENIDVRPYERPNLRFLGRKPYELVPQYIARFDVCLMPFADNEVARSVNPLKMYEYLALGKPVVSTHMAEVDAFRNVVRMVDPSAFPEAIVSAFESDSEMSRRNRVAAVSGRSWATSRTSFSMRRRVHETRPSALPPSVREDDFSRTLPSSNRERPEQTMCFRCLSACAKTVSLFR